MVELDVAASQPGSSRAGAATSPAWPGRCARPATTSCRGGVDVVVDADVPGGAGLSSSAALECAVAGPWSTTPGSSSSLDRAGPAARDAPRTTSSGPRPGSWTRWPRCTARAGTWSSSTPASLAVEPVAVRRRRPRPGPAGGRHAGPARPGRRRVRRAPPLLRAGRAATLGVPALRDVTVDDLDDALAPPRRRRRAPTRPPRRHRERAGARRRRRAAGRRRPARDRPALTASHASMRDDFEITVPAGRTSPPRRPRPRARTAPG